MWILTSRTRMGDDTSIIVCFRLYNAAALYRDMLIHGCWMHAHYSPLFVDPCVRQVHFFLEAFLLDRCYFWTKPQSVRFLSITPALVAPLPEMRRIKPTRVVYGRVIYEWAAQRRYIASTRMQRIGSSTFQPNARTGLFKIDSVYASLTLRRIYGEWAYEFSSPWIRNDRKWLPDIRSCS